MRYLILTLVSALSLVTLSACASSAQRHEKRPATSISSACPELEGYPDCQNGQIQRY